MGNPEGALGDAYILLGMAHETTISFDHYLDAAMRQCAALLKGAQTSIILLATWIVDDYHGRHTT
jgi:hypothetical protein